MSTWWSLAAIALYGVIWVGLSRWYVRELKKLAERER